ncbi:hypothetical protein QAD02_008133 [Eretmocerus hayati]|uniref:Uncharacterized protein n=1 Tax=Eretmocerus hayati TaxID=131215 RepID=A0ACC2N5W3_9HYME|nr:hypothetical protein QAD02_008133 [Eretmocerus hayati]
MVMLREVNDDDLFDRVDVNEDINENVNRFADMFEDPPGGQPQVAEPNDDLVDVVYRIVDSRLNRLRQDITTRYNHVMNILNTAREDIEQAREEAASARRDVATARVELQSQRIAAIQEAQNEIRAERNSILEEIRQDFEEENLAHREAFRGEMDDHQDEMLELYDRVSNRIDEIEERFDAIDNRINTIEERHALQRLLSVSKSSIEDGEGDDETVVKKAVQILGEELFIGIPILVVAALFILMVSIFSSFIL